MLFRSLRKRRGIGRRYRGGYPAPPGLAQRRQLVRDPVVHCFVAALAQRDQIPRAPGIFRIGLSRPDVVDVGRLDLPPIAQALSASVTIPPQDLRSEPTPARRCVSVPHAVLRHVGPAFGSGLSPPGKQKACADTNRRSGSCGTGTQAQALVDIYDGLHPAVLAVNHKRRCPSLWIESKDFTAPTPRAHQPSVLCNQSTTLFVRHEPFRSPFFKMSLLFNYISSSY